MNMTTTAEVILEVLSAGQLLDFFVYVHCAYVDLL